MAVHRLPVLGESSASVGATGAGAETSNNIGNTLEAMISDSEADGTTGVALWTYDAATITATAVSAALGITASAGGAVGGTVSVTPSTNNVSNTSRAGIRNSKVKSANGHVDIVAESATTIYADPVAVAVGVTVAPGSLDLTGGGAIGLNDVSNTIAAFIDENSEVEAGRGVSVYALDSSDINTSVVGGITSTLLPEERCFARMDRLSSSS